MNSRHLSEVFIIFFIPWQQTGKHLLMGDHYTGGASRERWRARLASSCDDHQRNPGVCETEEVSKPDLEGMSQDAQEATNSPDDGFSSCGTDVSVPELLPGRSPTSPSLHGGGVNPRQLLKLCHYSQFAVSPPCHQTRTSTLDRSANPHVGLIFIFITSNSWNPPKHLVRIREKLVVKVNNVTCHEGQKGDTPPPVHTLTCCPSIRTMRICC